MAQRSYDAKSREKKNYLDRGMIGFWIRVFIFFLGAFLIASIAWAKDQSPVVARQRERIAQMEIFEKSQAELLEQEIHTAKKK